MDEDRQKAVLERIEFEARLKAEVEALRNGDIVMDGWPFRDRYPLNADRPGAQERIDQATKNELKIYRETQAILNSNSVQSALKSFQTSIGDLEAIHRMAVSVFPAKPTKRTVEQRPSGIAVVKQKLIVVEFSPDPPQPDVAGWDAVFDWYYSVPRHVCRTLRELSEKVFCHYGTVRNRESDYRAQYGELPISKQH